MPGRSRRGRYTGAVEDEAYDPARVYASAQFRAAREKAEVKRSELRDEKLISEAALINFELGRSWPRARMQADLEERVGLPPGQIETWRREFRGLETQVPIVPTQDVIVDALRLALHGVEAEVEALPPPGDDRFWPAARSSLAALAKLDSTAGAAARVSPTMEVLTVLRTVRRRYDATLRMIAAARPDEFGPKLYVARTGAEMSIDEAAAAAGVTTALLNEIESCQTEPPPKVQALLSQLVSG
ncbi:XRE family transcriptional regulator [Mycobacteroides abscessus subsp. abscessus]|nr:XRE family transcriptional regulator [Mycobacteroides abscessus subsp. abscessus]